METIKSICAVVGAVVLAVGTAITVVKVLAKYGTHIIAACKKADGMVSSTIKKLA